MPYKAQNNVIFYSRFSTTGNTNFSFRSYFQRITSTKELGIFPFNPHCLSRQLFSSVITCRILDHPHLWLNEMEINWLLWFARYQCFCFILRFCLCVCVCVCVCMHLFTSLRSVAKHANQLFTCPFCTGPSITVDCSIFDTLNQTWLSF